jgi:hypothetical protein
LVFILLLFVQTPDTGSDAQTPCYHIVRILSPLHENSQQFHNAIIDRLEYFVCAPPNFGPT